MSENMPDQNQTLSVSGRAEFRDDTGRSENAGFPCIMGPAGERPRTLPITFSHGELSKMPRGVKIASMSGAPDDFRDTDTAVIDLLRGDKALEIGHLAEQLGVTATAVRQRLDRLMRAGLVERRAISRPRGRPAHAYSLTAAGRRLGGDNFRDLAMVLWKEVRAVADDSVRRGLLNRVGGALAEVYRDRITGSSSADRLADVAAVFADRDIACSVERGALPVLTTYSCPYPELADQDRAICAAERLMIQELVGAAVQLSECRLDGAPCCRFTAAEGPSAEEVGGSCHDSPEGVERNKVRSSNAGRFPVQSTAPESLP